MAEQDALGFLKATLSKAETITDLYKTAASDSFKSASKALPAEQLTDLRNYYRSLQTSLDGKVKLEQFDGQVLRVLDVEYWHSDTYDNNGVTIRFEPEHEEGKQYKALTSSAPIVRFFSKEESPTAYHGVRILCQLTAHKDKDKAGKGWKQWTIRRLPELSSGQGSMPF